MRKLPSLFAASLVFALVGIAQAGGPDPDRKIVKFRTGQSENAKAALRGAGATVLLELPEHNAAAARVPAAALEALQRNPNIEYVEPDHPRYPFAQTTPYGIPMVQADQVSDAGAGGRKVCIIDSGYFKNHEDLQDTHVTKTDNSGTGDAFTDGCGHGTHVAGTIAALTNTTGVVGVMPGGNVNLHIVKVFGNDCGWAYSSSLVAALDACRAAGSNVVSMSLGGSFSSRTEDTAFANAYNAGVLSIAAAGNDGSTRKSYPASYASVVSVAAIDSAKNVASFSQKNDAVEIAAPGVSVLSTVPWKSSSVTSASGNYNASSIEGSGAADASGTLVDGGLCGSAGSWSGKVVLCERGTYSFAEKVAAVNSGGGVAAIIYNNVSGGFAGTCNGDCAGTIPAVSISQEDGLVVKGDAGSSATVSNTTGAGSGYEAWDGTSMATPHVSAVAALVWSYNPGWTNQQIRDALTSTAEDLGAAGKDNSYGYGLVQAKAALDALQGGGGGGCTPTEANEVSCSDGQDNDCDGAVDSADSDCGGGGSCGGTGDACSSNADCCPGLSCKTKGKWAGTCR